MEYFRSKNEIGERRGKRLSLSVILVWLGFYNLKRDFKFQIIEYKRVKNGKFVGDMRRVKAHKKDSYYIKLVLISTFRFAFELAKVIKK